MYHFKPYSGSYSKKLENMLTSAVKKDKIKEKAKLTYIVLDIKGEIIDEKSKEVNTYDFFHKYGQRYRCSGYNNERKKIRNDAVAIVYGLSEDRENNPRFKEIHKMPQIDSNRKSLLERIRNILPYNHE